MGRRDKGKMDMQQEMPLSYRNSKIILERFIKRKVIKL
jgi:hypothetical protein